MCLITSNMSCLLIATANLTKAQWLFIFRLLRWQHIRSLGHHTRLLCLWSQPPLSLGWRHLFDSFRKSRKRNQILGIRFMTLEQEIEYVSTLTPLSQADFPFGTYLRPHNYCKSDEWYPILFASNESVWLRKDLDIAYKSLVTWEYSTDNGKTWRPCHK